MQPVAWNSLIHIPERVNDGDFVLKLGEGVKDASATIRSYVVTSHIKTAFEVALGTVVSSLQDGRSRAAYLNGGFGSGKSHFMAMLHLLLTNHPEVLKLEALTPVVAQHVSLRDKKLLVLNYHMVGARSMESAILGGYATQMRERHPEHPTPAVYLATSLFADAQGLRQRMGDDAFFASLNEEATPKPKWGKLGGSAWDAARFERAISQRPEESDRAALISVLLDRHYTSYRNVANESGEAFVSLDVGLQIIADHAQKAGYDGVVLFLDELILWLASHAGNLPFMNAEGQKLAKLVEAENATRAVPIISFVARQRDLREFLGDGVLGAEYKALADSLGHWEGRFSQVSLREQDLPRVVNQRLLQPRLALDAEVIRRSFEDTMRRMREDERARLTTRDADEDGWRQIYPFTPALMQALIALSSLLQRDRTALRLLSQLLSRHREDLMLGQMVPVGDLWDVISQGDQPFHDVMKAQFDAARRVWETKLRPAIRADFSFDPTQWEGQREADLTEEVRRSLRQLRTAERIGKTLLIHALVPGVEAMQDMTMRRLHALNWGAVRAALPGQEGATIGAMVGRWANRVSELEVSLDSDPKVHLRLSAFDTDEIIRFGASHDNQGNRRQRLIRMLAELLGLHDGISSDASATYTREWRGAKRSLRVKFRNVRELDDEQLRSDDLWTLVVDYPFDLEQNRGPQDDWHRLQDWTKTHPAGTRTLAWLPRFLSAAGQHQVGRLLRVEFTLAQFEGAVSSLAPEARGAVKAELISQQQQIQARLERTLLVAYGLASPDASELIDWQHQDHETLVCLQAGQRVHPAAGPTFEAAIGQLAEQLLLAQHPAAPSLPNQTPSGKQLANLLEVLRNALEHHTERLPLPDKATESLVSQWLVPLGLGVTGDASFVVNRDRAQEIRRGLRDKTPPWRVADLRTSFDPPEASTGLSDALKDLLVCYLALATHHDLEHAGRGVDLSTKLHGDVRLVPQRLPSDDEWKQLEAVLPDVFGIAKVAQRANKRTLQELHEVIEPKVAQAKPALERLADLLQRMASGLGVDDAVLESGARMRTLHVARQLCAEFQRPRGKKLWYDAILQHVTVQNASVVSLCLFGAETLVDLFARYESDLHTLTRMAQPGWAHHARTDSMVDAAREWVLQDVHLATDKTLVRLLNDVRHEMLELAEASPSGPIPGLVSVPAPETALATADAPAAAMLVRSDLPVPPEATRRQARPTFWVRSMDDIQRAIDLMQAALLEGRTVSVQVEEDDGV